MRLLGREIRCGVLAGVVCLLALGASAATVSVDSDCIGMGTVVSSERRLANGTSRLALVATAADGFAFAGWSVADRDVIAWPDDQRYPGSLTPTVASNAVITALFVSRADDELTFDISDIFPEEIDCGEAISEVLSVYSASFPKVTFRNLPPGLSFDNRTLTVWGEPNAPGLYRIEADAVNESGFTFRSCCTMRVRNLEGARVSGLDTEIPVGEYFYSEIGDGDISDIFWFDETPTSVAVSGVVPGLTWSNSWSVIYGTPTEIGEYTLKAKASFPTGRVETATMTLEVLGAEPDDYGLDLDPFESLQVGDSIDEPCRIGADASDFRIVGVTGLPSGLSASFRYEGGVRQCFVSGTVRGAGFFTVAVQVEDRSEGTSRAVSVVRTVMVEDAPDNYLAVKSSDPEYGTVSGGGAVSPVDDVTLVATPRAGSVFAGWYDSNGDPLVLLEGVDYRTPEITLPAGTDFAFLEPVAHFAPKEDDAAPDLSELEDAEFSFAPGEPFESDEISVDSLSLPTLTFRGLPRGMSCAATGVGGFVLAYDPQVAVAASKRSVVTATAVNASGRKSSVTFRVTVEAQSDARIRVYDDYGEFTPGEKIDPIDLSDAVDFARGETLSVSGLPKGLVYNAKANAKKSVEARTITGTPTVPGDYTLTFTAKVVAGVTTNRQGVVSRSYETATATAFLTVLDYPELEIDVDEDAAAAGCKVKGAGNYKAGTKVSLKATAAKGWVFAGWDGFDELEGLEALNPKFSCVTDADDVWVQATFVPVSEDGLTIAAPALTEAGYAAEWPLKEKLGEDDATLIADLIKTVSWPTVKVAGLPSGVKFSASTFLLSGKPTKSGVSHVTVTAKNAGGYSFVRILDIAVRNANGSLPEEKAPANAAEIDFTPLKGLTTGVYCPTGAVVLSVGPKPGTASAVGKVSVSGLPKGLSAAVALQGDGATVGVQGTPTKPGRQTVSISVTYADGQTLKSQETIVVEDGGSAYLFVASADSDAGTVSGEGVYASGATVKLVAKAKSKQVFAGWRVPDGEAGLALFAPIRERDGIDPRAATVAFPFRPADFSGSYEITGTFVPVAEDAAAEIELEADCWQIDPSEPSSFAFAVDSLSVPKVTVSGLSKGVAVDAARGLMTYTPSSATVPGVVTATVSAKNATQKKATVRTFEIQVANRVSDAIGGLDPDADAYPLSVGTAVDSALITPTVGADWKLTAKGLPPGLSFKNGVITGVPSKTGNYTVTFTATTGKGKGRKTEMATITVRVTALPTTLAGTFTGVLAESADAMAPDASAETFVGSVKVTATAAGKVTVAVQTAAKKISFAAKSWDAFSNGVATVQMSDKGGSSCALSVKPTDDWQSWQTTGEVALTAGATPLKFEAQRNPYGAKDGFAEARASAENLAGKSSIDGWTVQVKANGTVKISGKYAGKSISGSTVLQWDDGEPVAIYVAFLDKKTSVCFVFSFGEDGKVSRWMTN